MIAQSSQRQYPRKNFHQLHEKECSQLLDVNTRLHGRTDDAARVLVSKNLFDIFMVVSFFETREGEKKVTFHSAVEVNLAPSHANIQRSTTIEHVHLVFGLVDRNRRRCICCFLWRVAFEEVQAVHVFLISFNIVERLRSFVWCQFLLVQCPICTWLLKIEREVVSLSCRLP